MTTPVMPPTHGEIPTDAEHSRIPLEEVVSEFLTALRGDRYPSIESFAAAHPALADDLRQLLPLVLALDDLSVTKSGTASEFVRKGLTPGTEFGLYGIVREVGRGGMGVVYEALERTTGRRVALKLVAAQPESRASSSSIWREPVMAAKLAHPRIVPVYTSGRQDGLKFYAMMLVPGVGLDRVIRWLRDHYRITSEDIRRAAAGEIAGPANALAEASAGTATPTTSLLGQQSWVQFAKIGVQIATALAHAHQRSVLHRDIKPGNILLDAQGAVWITDFGLARPSEQPPASDPQRHAGTLRYMAPEQLKGEADFRTDLYSVGVTLYELCTQKAAFAGADRKDMMERIRRGAVIRPRQHNHRMPSELERIILRAMDIKPHRRYQTADALRRDLIRFVQKATRQAGWWREWMPWGKRG